VKPEDEEELKQRQLQALRDSEANKKAAGMMGGGCCGIIMVPFIALALIFIVVSIANCAGIH
jgi:uncharacterized membrane protein